MYVLQGLLKGRKLPAGIDNVRPLCSNMRRYLCDIIEYQDKLILDVCAGTGSFGIEALSSGAKSCIFVDTNYSTVTNINNFLSLHNLNGKAIVLNATRLPQAQEFFDIAFVDPPYNCGMMEKILDKLISKSWLDPAGILITKYNKPIVRQLTCIKERVFGETKINIWTI